VCFEQLERDRQCAVSTSAPGAANAQRHTMSHQHNNHRPKQSAQRVYNTFNAWDVDGNGTLSRCEFSRISQGTMSDLFIARVFEEHVAAPRGGVWPPPDTSAAASPSKQQQQDSQLNTGAGAEAAAASPAAAADLPNLGLRLRTASSDGASSSGSPTQQQQQQSEQQQQQQQPGTRRHRMKQDQAVGACTRDEMDMMAFVDFVLAWDHRNHPAALGYFFAIFDLQHKVGCCGLGVWSALGCAVEGCGSR